jgi:uncharacterized protein YkuJ
VKSREVSETPLNETISRPKITVKLPANGEKKTLNEASYNPKTAVYFDKNGNQISQGTYRNIKNYENTLKVFENQQATKDRMAQYDTIEKLNGLAHSIARKTGDKSIEKATYTIKDNFAIQEMNIR